jgi:hypothetical protein
LHSTNFSSCSCWISFTFSNQVSSGSAKFPYSFGPSCLCCGSLYWFSKGVSCAEDASTMTVLSWIWGLEKLSSQ